MVLPQNARIENAREAGQRIDRGINAALHDLPAQVRGRIKVRESRGRRGIGIIVRRHINRLHGSDRSALGRRDAFLQLADFGVEVRLVTYCRRHTAEKRRYFRTRLHEAENIVDEEQHVEMLFVAEIFRDGQAGQADAQARAGRFGHLSVNQRAARLFRISGNNDARFLHFEPQVVSFARPLAHSREHRNAAVLHGDVVNQFLNQHRLAHARAAEQADLAAFKVGLNQIDDLDAGLEHFERCGLILQRRCRAMNGIALACFHLAELVDWFA